MSIQIDKEVPIPENRGAKNKYPLGQMEVGDSFEVLTDKAGDVRNSVTAIARRNHKPKKFITRTTTGGMRCWRIE